SHQHLGVLWDDFVADQKTNSHALTLDFEPLPFNHPLFIMYSSGTTGIPKCIIHSAGGAFLRQLCELVLNCDIKAKDRLFYFTTCGWMMWNWMLPALACEAGLMIYDGSPLYPGANILFDYAEKHQITHFGTSAKFIDTLKKQDYPAHQKHNLKALRTLLSTGSPLVAESYDYVYRQIKQDLHLVSISGGTDLLGCFVGANPIGPVYRGQIQVATLGMDIEIWSEKGKPVQHQKGELVCKKPFSSMPLGFWNDPDGQKYFNAYFTRFKNVWCHGDFAEQTVEGGFIIHGRSDATLNAGGVRIGTAEIYRQVEQFDQIEESVAVGQEWNDDTRIILFVRMKNNQKHLLNDDLKQAIRQKLRTNCSPRHVPSKIIAIDDIPRTRSGKITELAIRDTIHHRPINNKEALMNPEALNFYQHLKELNED
ncbi:MAG: acetoacetate--CoA ligase, partial [Pseudomonadota bacterium]